MSEKKVTNAEIVKITDRNLGINYQKLALKFFALVFFPLIDRGKLYCMYLLIQHWGFFGFLSKKKHFLSKVY